MTPLDPWIIDERDERDERDRRRAPRPTVREPTDPAPCEQAPDRGVKIIEISPDDDTIQI